MVAAHSAYSSNVILSLSFLLLLCRGRCGDVSETSYIGDAEFSANRGFWRNLSIHRGFGGEGRLTTARGDRLRYQFVRSTSRQRVPSSFSFAAATSAACPAGVLCRSKPVKLMMIAVVSSDSP